MSSSQQYTDSDLVLPDLPGYLRPAGFVNFSCPDVSGRGAPRPGPPMDRRRGGGSASSLVDVRSWPHPSAPNGAPRARAVPGVYVAQLIAAQGAHEEPSFLVV